MIIRFPVQLPPNFLVDLGCAESETRFVAFHYDNSGELLIRENGQSLRICKKKNAWVYHALTIYPPVTEWLDANNVDLLTYWLIYDYETFRCYLADKVDATKMLVAQVLPNGIQNGKSSTNSQRPARRKAK